MTIDIIRTGALAAAAIATLVLGGAATGARAADQNSAPAVESFVEVQGPAGLLKGTMLSPAGKARALVLIIPGSGPTDRDGDNPLGIKARPYKLLAEALAERGVASVRIDKRGMFASAAPGVDANKVTIEAYAADIRAWVAMLRAKTSAPCVWLAGHSEGSLVAEVTAQHPDGLCGLVLISGAGRRLGDVIRQQFKDNPANAPLAPDADKALTALEAGRTVDVAGMHPALQGLFNPAVQGYLISLLSYDPAALLKAYPGPVLVAQGTHDLQVTLEDAHRLASARPGIELVELPGVNHVLKAAPADQAGNFATYADPSLPLGPGVADAVAGFVTRKR